MKLSNILKILEETRNHCLIVEKYAKEQGLWYDYNESSQCKIKYNEEINFDISKTHSVLAGPKRPQDKVLLTNVHKKSIEVIKEAKNAFKANRY